MRELRRALFGIRTGKKPRVRMEKKPRTGARIGHRLTIVREALEPLQEKRTGALERVDGLGFFFLLV